MSLGSKADQARDIDYVLPMDRLERLATLTQGFIYIRRAKSYYSLPHDYEITLDLTYSVARAILIPFLVGN